jgi:hypothetical protein
VPTSSIHRGPNEHENLLPKYVIVILSSEESELDEDIGHVMRDIGSENPADSSEVRGHQELSKLLVSQELYIMMQC